MRRRRDARGQLDVRKTVRHSLSTGGVPFEAAFRHRAPHRPELAVVCDVSGSVARFARFGLMLTHSLAARFTRVRSFAFVDTVDEVTRFFDREDFIEAVDRMKDEAQVTSSDGRTDYGRTFAQLLREYPGAIGPKTTLLILGDAWNNYRLRNEDDLRELAWKAHRTYWLNPEPWADWDTDDSVASAYAPYVDRMVEVRNLRQLEDFIARQLDPQVDLAGACRFDLFRRLPLFVEAANPSSSSRASCRRRRSARSRIAARAGHPVDVVHRVPPRVVLENADDLGVRPLLVLHPEHSERASPDPASGKGRILHENERVRAVRRLLPSCPGCSRSRPGTSSPRGGAGPGA